LRALTTCSTRKPANDGIGIGPQGIFPLVAVFGVAPTGFIRRDEGCGAIGKRLGL
jgi:hypothetical protein